MKIITATPVPASIYYNDKVVCNIPNSNNKLKRCVTNDTILGDYTAVFDMITLEEERNTHLIKVSDNSESFKVEALITKKNDNTSRTIDIQQGDLLGAPVELVLNFTEYDVCVKTFNNFVKVFPRITNKKLLSLFEGKILFISIYSLNRESIIKEIYNINNFYKNWSNKYPNEVNKEIVDIYAFIKQKQDELIETYSYSDFGTAANSKDKISTLKVCTLLTIDGDEFKVINTNNEIVKTIYLTSKNILVSIKPIDQIEDHPYGDFILNLNKNNYELIKDNLVASYIVDNDSRLGPRYFNFAGHVLKIINIKDTTKEDGLYIEYGLTKIFIQLQNILDGKVEYIYTSKEEAESGADIKKKYEEQISKIEFERKIQLSNLQKELDNTLSKNKELAYELETKKLITKNELETELLKIKSEHEEKSKELELKYKEEIYKLNKELEESKNKEEKKKIKLDRLEKELDYARSKLKYDFEVNSLNRKSSYEDKKYSQEISIETMKTIGIIASLAVTGFLLYNKYKSN